MQGCMLLGRVLAIDVQLDEAGVQLAGTHEGNAKAEQFRCGTLFEMIVVAAVPVGSYGGRARPGCAWQSMCVGKSGG